MPLKKNAITPDHSLHTKSKKTSKSVDYENQPYFKMRQHQPLGPPSHDKDTHLNMQNVDNGPTQSLKLHHLLRQVEQLKNEMNQHNTTHQYNKFKELNKSFDQKYQHALAEHTAQKKVFKQSIDALMVNHSLYCEKQIALQHLDDIIVKMGQLQWCNIK